MRKEVKRTSIIAVRKQNVSYLQTSYIKLFLLAPYNKHLINRA